MVKEKVKKSKIKGFTSKLIELKLLIDRIVEGKGAFAGPFTVKYQVLFLISSKGRVSPSELMANLNMAKSNIALLAKSMIKEGLILKVKEDDNKKQIYYEITEKGEEKLSEKLNSIEDNLSSDKKEDECLYKTIEILKNKK